MKKKISIIFTIIGLVIFSGAFFYEYYNKKQVITSNPYVNNKYNFSFSYPSNIILKTSKSDKSAYVSIYKKKPEDEVESLTIGSVLIKGISNQEYIDKWKNLTGTKFFSQDTVKGNGLSWTTVTANGSFFNTRIVSTERNGLIYALVLSSPLINDDTKNIYQSIENEFISTFKFEIKK